MKPAQKFQRLMAHMATVLEFDLDNTGFYFGDEMFDYYDTPQDLGVDSQDVIEVHDLV